jgi:hypothetical protein
VDETPPVRVSQRVSELDGVPKHFRDWEGALEEPLCKRPSFEIFHHEETDRVWTRIPAGARGFAYVVETADMWMIERCDSAGLTFESFSAAGVDNEFLGQHLDRNDPIKPRVACLIYLTHAAGPNQPENFVGPQANAGYERHAKSLKVRRIIWSNQFEMADSARHRASRSRFHRTRRGR